MAAFCESGRVFVYAVREAGTRVGNRLREGGLGGVQVVVISGGEGAGAVRFREIYAEARAGDVVVFVGACGIPLYWFWMRPLGIVWCLWAATRREVTRWLTALQS
jgi:hypothetical protein